MPAMKRKRTYSNKPAVKRSRPSLRARTVAMTPETKYFDTGINTVVTMASANWADTEVPCDNYVNTSGTAAAYTDSALIPSACGSGYGEVNGNRYKLKKIRVRGSITSSVGVDQADAFNPIEARVMLVMDTQPNGAQAQGEDVMQDIGAIGENIYSYQRVSATSGRFRVLKDEFCVIDPTNSQTDGTNTGSIAYGAKQFSFMYQPKVPLQVNIASGNSTPTIAGLQTCNIFLMVGSSRSNAAGTGSQYSVVVKAASRAYYVD